MRVLHLFLSFLLLLVLFKFVAGARAADAPATQPVAVLLEKAIYTEETAGDVDGAIKMYREIVKQNAQNRKYAAQAQYRLGQAYLKKKDPKQALAAFKELVKDYADQTDVVADARQKIVTLRGQVGDVSDLGPMIKKTSPEALAENVDPSLDKITVTFDRKMRNNSWSWTGGGETFPQSAGKISYDETLTTCTMPVKLEPGKVYWIGVNSPSFKNFKGGDGKPAQRYAICFATKSADGKPTKIPDDMKQQAKAINESVDKGEPIVLKTNPVALATTVSPKLKQVTVTFDQQMMNGSWSWCGGGETFPKLTGKPSYDTGRTTCRLPVELQPGKVYWIGINSPSNLNFQNPANAPAKRYVILFATASADGKPTEIPEDLLADAKEINAASGSPATAATSSTPTRQ
ncbi:MAG TPA: tetratricopeptide repeat protein [Tepidisphaeraceae bacterium]|jgi:tetratricopeptide (TPR) repeat protein